MGDQRRSRTRGSARDARRAARAKPQLEQIPYITRRIPVYELASDELLELVETNAETILAEIGIEFNGDPEALKLWADAGADVDAVRLVPEAGVFSTLCAGGALLGWLVRRRAGGAT